MHNVYSTRYNMHDIIGKMKGSDEMAPVSKAQQKATAKYMKATLDDIKVRVPKGRREEIKAHAEQQGESLNSFIIRAIDETIERDKNKTTHK